MIKNIVSILISKNILPKSGIKNFINLIIIFNHEKFKNLFCILSIIIYIKEILHNNVNKITEWINMKLKIKFLANLLLLFIFSSLKIQSQETLSNEECMTCHSDTSLGINYITGDHLKGSVHEKFDCVQCHSSITEIPHNEELADVNCSDCHKADAEKYEIHGWMEVGKNDEIPKCKDCHGTHNIYSADNPKSTVSPRILPQTCGKCHEDSTFVKKHKIAFREPADIYLKSVHGKGTSGGVEMAASCNDCHATQGTPHDIRAPGDPNSSINFFNIPKTCGRCHRIVYDEYIAGVHGELLKRGETDAPNCTNCHGKHNILSNEDPKSTVHPNRVANAVCGPCHESDRIRERYGIPGKRLSTYIDSYHGLKSSVGDITVASCASCHGAHSNLSADNPESKVAPHSYSSFFEML